MLEILLVTEQGLIIFLGTGLGGIKWKGQQAFKIRSAHKCSALHLIYKDRA